MDPTFRIRKMAYDMEGYYQDLKHKMPASKFKKRVRYHTIAGWFCATLSFLAFTILFIACFIGNKEQAGEFLGAIILFGILTLSSLLLTIYYYKYHNW
jgi:hypothetical protein